MRSGLSPGKAVRGPPWTGLRIGPASPRRAVLYRRSSEIFALALQKRRKHKSADGISRGGC